ncbi:MAG: GntR family transcriptional regulator [Phycisphaerae bacterium]|nr:GntR family transcriptional regulator [Phycisphaerae bacterium]
MCKTENDDLTRPLYAGVKKLILKEIQQKNLKEGDCLQPEMELCKKYNVSRITVRRALSELAREKVLYRISGKGTFITKSLPNSAYTIEKSSQIAVIVPDIEDLATSAIFAGLDEAANKCGYEVIVNSCSRRIDKENYNLDSLIQRNSVGAIIFPNWGTSNVDHIFELKRRKHPFVLIDRFFRDVETDYVVTNNLQGAYQAVSHLIELGHQRIGFIGGVDTTAACDRLDGYKKTLSKYGLVIFEDIIVAPDKKALSSKGLEPDSGGYDETKKILAADPPPTAIFAANDTFALNAMRAIRDAGLKVPDDIAVVGFDNLKFSSLLEVPLTTVAQPFYEIGRKAMEILIDKIEGKVSETQQIVLEPRLIVRDSCGAKKLGKVHSSSKDVLPTGSGKAVTNVR